METLRDIGSIVTYTIGIITLSLLAMATIRDIVVKFSFLNTNNPRQGRWFYNLFKPYYEIQILTHALDDMGYSNSEIASIRYAERDKFSGTLDKYYKENLIALIINYIYSLPGEKVVGSNNKKTKYYIHTMEMAHDRRNLWKLTRIMYNLIIHDNKLKGDTIDFILVPKGGNLLLARRIADEFKADLLVLKGKDEESSVKISIDDEPEIYFRINFEGGNVLLKAAEANPGKKLNGIVVDCNASGCSQVYNAIQTFAKAVDKKVINANRIEAAYVLFRVDNEDFDFGKYRLVRYFDLNEKLKEELYGYSTKNKAFDYKEKENIIIIDNFIKKMRREKKGKSKRRKLKKGSKL